MEIKINYNLYRTNHITYPCIYCDKNVNIYLKHRSEYKNNNLYEYFKNG